MYFLNNKGNNKIGDRGINYIVNCNGWENLIYLRLDEN
jgi:hypothetical protein